MKLNERLHLVIPLYEDETIYAYVHCAPLSLEAFEAHFTLVSKTFTSIHAEGLGEIGGPRVAAMVLRKTAKAAQDETGALALMNEIRRLANVTIRSPSGWQTMPYQEVADAGKIGQEDLMEVENAAVFFIVSSCMLRRRMAQDMLTGAAKLWGAQTTLSDFTAFAASLRTSTPAVSSGESLRPGVSVPH